MTKNDSLFQMAETVWGSPGKGGTFYGTTGCFWIGETSSSG